MKKESFTLLKDVADSYPSFPGYSKYETNHDAWNHHIPWAFLSLIASLSQHADFTQRILTCFDMIFHWQVRNPDSSLEGFNLEPSNFVPCMFVDWGSVWLINQIISKMPHTQTWPILFFDIFRSIMYADRNIQSILTNKVNMSLLILETPFPHQ